MFDMQAVQQGKDRQIGKQPPHDLRHGRKNHQGIAAKAEFEGGEYGSDLL